MSNHAHASFLRGDLTVAHWQLHSQELATHKSPAFPSYRSRVVEALQPSKNFASCAQQFKRPFKQTMAVSICQLSACALTARANSVWVSSASLETLRLGDGAASCTASCETPGSPGLFGKDSSDLDLHPNLGRLPCFTDWIGCSTSSESLALCEPRLQPPALYNAISSISQLKDLAQLKDCSDPKLKGMNGSCV